MSALAMSGMMFTFSCNRFMNSISSGFSLRDRETERERERECEGLMFQSKHGASPKAVTQVSSVEQ